MRTFGCNTENAGMILFAKRMQPHHKTPHTPTNEERLQWFRMMRAETEVPVIGNAIFKFGREYERDAMLDGRYPSREF